ncbi:MAG: hypothetical protein K6A72_09620 [Lachnospiraceae bacterium]|nr:hypothetical protein [Lachnospiraceae bacterium]
MKLEKVKNTKKGLVYGTINRVVGLLLPFVIQTVTIHRLGIEYIGVKGLFSSVLTVFSLAELGFGSAIVYAMYKPIAEDNKEEINALLKLYRKIYRIIGLVILIIGLALVPFLGIIVKEECPGDLSLTLVYLLYLANTVISYWMFSYKASVLNAYQRYDVISNISTITLVVSSSVQILVLCVWKDFYAFLVVMVFATVLNNLITYVAVKRLYPEIKCEGQVGEAAVAEIKKKVLGLLTGKVCGVTRNTFDSIFISGFLGWTQTAIYSNYFYIIIALNSFTSVILGALLGGVGNSIVLESKQKNYKDMMTMNNIYLFIAGAMAICMLCLYQPFMSKWMGPENVYPSHIMILFPIYFYMTKMGDIRGVYADAAGLFWENRWRYVAEAVLNIFLNYILGKLFGVVGILAATILIVFFVAFLGSTHVAFKHYFEKGMKKYLGIQFIMLAFTFLAGALVFSLCCLINYESEILTFLIRSVICLVLIPLLYWAVFHRTSEYKEAREFIIRVVLKKA